MIAFVRGIVFLTRKDSVVVDHQGIGYEIIVPNPKTYTYGSEVMFYTYQHVREDAIQLFGFASLNEYDLFIRLIDVKGLGPKTAINILSVASVNALVQAIENNDVAYLKSMPGIGAKTAQQIVLDLKGKLVLHEQQQSSEPMSDVLHDASDALLALGYKNTEINKVMKEIVKMDIKSSDEAIRIALGLLLNRK